MEDGTKGRPLGTAYRRGISASVPVLSECSIRTVL